jgi:hypothetical protein
VRPPLPVLVWPSQANSRCNENRRNHGAKSKDLDKADQPPLTHLQMSNPGVLSVQKGNKVTCLFNISHRHNHRVSSMCTSQLGHFPQVKSLHRIPKGSIPVEECERLVVV